MASPQRVSVFIDSENLYWDARRAFHKNAGPASYGQIDPRRYAELLVARGRAGVARDLQEVHVFVGVPGSSQQPQAYAARRRQIAAWRKNGISVFDRPLRYPGDWPMSKPQEKGIDVALAVGLVFGAARRFYDVGIVASTDTDLVPALEAVCDMNRAWGTPAIEVAAWSPNNKRLRVSGVNTWCHWLGEAEYLSVRDTTNYTRKP